MIRQKKFAVNHCADWSTHRLDEDDLQYLWK